MPGISYSLQNAALPGDKQRIQNWILPGSFVSRTTSLGVPTQARHTISWQSCCFFSLSHFYRARTGIILSDPHSLFYTFVSFRRLPFVLNIRHCSVKHWHTI